MIILPPIGSDRFELFLPESQNGAGPACKTHALYAFQALCFDRSEGVCRLAVCLLVNLASRRPSAA